MSTTFRHVATPESASHAELVASDGVNLVVGQNDRLVALYPDMGSERARIERDFQAEVAAAQEVLEDLTAALAHHEVSLVQVRQQGAPGPWPGGAWPDVTRRLADAIRYTKVPLFKAKRLEVAKSVLDRSTPYLAQYGVYLRQRETYRNSRLMDAEGRAYNEWKGRVRKALGSGDLGGPEILGSPSEPPAEGMPSWLGGCPVEGVARPVCFVGDVVLEAMNATARVAVPHSPTSIGEEIPIDERQCMIQAPLMLDLDACGGLVSSDRNTIESAVVQLFESIPAGRVKVDCVDPVGLGESLNYLYALNDAKLLGDAVWTTADHAARLMVELEQHVTFVTQKYLQGRHESLTEYNVEAGEVAEPYRLVLLYDFPRMFTRDGRVWDEEALDRLGRLARVGRRAGVFFLVHCPDDERLQTLGQLVLLRSDQGFGMPTQVRDSGFLGQVGLTWGWSPPPAVPLETRDGVLRDVVRGVGTAADAKVAPESVVTLADKDVRRRADLGFEEGRVLARADDSATWWKGSSTRSIVSHFGRMGASDVARVVFNSEMESSALIGGRPGSGKSFLFHSLIFDLVLNYSPDELELYLIDLKEGIEFKQYAEHGLPHARAVAIESNREFAVSVLRSLDAEIKRRGALFKEGGGTTVNLTALREVTGDLVPRVVLMVDEFHKLFEKDDGVRREAEQLLERVIKEGRAFGVHVVLGSQSIALVGSAFRSIADQIFYRLVMASSEADSRLLLGEGNPDAHLLTRAGEGLLNAQGGVREANNRFMTTFWDPSRRAEVLAELRRKADGAGADRRPVVFEGAEPVPVESLPREIFGRSSPHGALRVVVGSPMSLEPPFTAELDRSPGRNLLVVDEEYRDLVVALAVDLAQADVDVTIVDFGSFDVDTEPLRDALWNVVTARHFRTLTDTLREGVDEVARRLGEKNYSGRARVLVISGLQRARDLDADDYAVGPDDPSGLLRTLVTDGPEVGMHVVVAADRPASVERRLGTGVRREFGIKVIGTMSGEDSRRLVDSEAGSQLKASEVYFDDYDRVISRVLRRHTVTDTAWITAGAADVQG